MSSNRKLSKNFLDELFRLILKNKNILEACIGHLKYEHLPTIEYKELWRQIQTHYNLNLYTPSYGVLSEQFKKEPKILQQLAKIKEAELVAPTELLPELEEYLKKAHFLDLNAQLADLWKEGYQDKAIELLTQQAEVIANLSIQGKHLTPIIQGFRARYNQRQIENLDKIGLGHSALDKCRFGIDSIDQRTNGGVDKTDTALFTARSGVGKSKVLKHIGISNARVGKNMIHVQAEGSKKEAELAYETGLAGSTLADMELTALDADFVESLFERLEKITGDIHIVAYEQFNTATMLDIRNTVVAYNRTHSKPADGLLIDYIDKIDPGNGKRYSTNAEGEKARRQALADSFKNLCVEENLSGFTATQASDVSKERWNNPREVLTRSDVKGDKNVIDPYSYHFTLNRTEDEAKQDLMRIHYDKIRKYKGTFTDKIYTGYNRERFYDRKRTLNAFGSKK